MPDSFMNTHIHICSFSDGDFEIEVGGEVITFEWSNQFGPMPLTKRGYERRLRHSHPFWRAVSLWAIQGKRKDGVRAIWHEPKRPVTEHIGGRNYRVIEEGEPGWDI